MLETAALYSDKKTAATLEDVARTAGVSKYTVSAVINRTNSNTRVSAQTRQRILDAAATLQYRPNAIALSLKRRRTDLIGLYNGYGGFDARNRFLGEIIGGLQEGCDRHGKDLVLFRIFKGHTADHIYPALVDGKVDGLVIYAPMHDALTEKLTASHLPVVAISDALPSLPSVVIDDAQGGRQQAEHLAERGHERILYRAAFHARRSTTRRMEGFLEAAGRLGMTVHITRPSSAQTHGVSEEERALLQGPKGERPTAAVCWEDEHADALMLECHRLGIRVPGDLAVMGFDGLEPTRAPAWHLTTVRAPWVQVAATAVSLLMEQMEGRPVALETILPVTLFAGETT